ncbi:MAG: GNAT family N-acetyltransferase [Cyanobacteria bacterium J06638_22]
MEIRPAAIADAEGMWEIFRRVVATEDTYVFAADTSREEAIAYLLPEGGWAYVAEAEGQIVGLYRMVANQRDLGSHVANASFMVHPEWGGKGIGTALGWHCLRQAKAEGFLVMQFNIVVSTNEAAVRLWKKLGFAIVGTLPKAIRNKQLGYVDAYVMYRFLDDISAPKS